MNESGTFVFSAAPIPVSVAADVLEGRITRLVLGADSLESLNRSRQFLDNYLRAAESPVYGVNTGFGFLAGTRIDEGKLSELQVNLMRSHACGTGEYVPLPVTRLMLFLKIRSLCMGYSAVRTETVQRLVDFFNLGITPLVYTQGSLGASGDLAPLAHLCLPLIGEGEFFHAGKLHKGQEIESMFGLQPLHPAAKEGLALLNGTQFMLAWALSHLHHARRLMAWAGSIASLSLEAWDCRPDPFHPSLHRIRPHAGQIAAAAGIRSWIDDSPSMKQQKKQVQDPYSFRCIPQVHGAVYDALAYCESAFEAELNAATDNPNVFPEEGLILSGGNFHGEPLALPLDMLAIALSELGSISERRTYLLLSGQRGLPLFLSPEPGLHSGMMIPQYTAAALASENKIHAQPASIDSIPSSNGQEDHVSMGSIAAVKADKLIKNVYGILGIEALCASQALYLKQDPPMAANLSQVLARFRKQVPVAPVDRVFSEDIRKASEWLRGEDPR